MDASNLNNQIVLQGQGQEKKSPEENLLLCPVKKTKKDIGATLKYLNSHEVRSLREERHISLGKVETYYENGYFIL